MVCLELRVGALPDCFRRGFCCFLAVGMDGSMALVGYMDKPFVYFLVARTNWLMTPPEMLEIHAIFDMTTFFSFQLSFFLFLRL